MLLALVIVIAFISGAVVTGDVLTRPAVSWAGSVMRLKTTKTFLLAVVFSFAACAVMPEDTLSADLLTEARALRIKNPRVDELELGEIPSKYLPEGMLKSDALSYLTERGFTVTQIPRRPDEYIASKRESPPVVAPPFSHDEYRITLVFSGDKLKSVKGKFFIHTL